MRGKHLFVISIASLAAVGTLLAGGGQDDLKKIQGTWQFTAQAMDGKPRPSEQLTKLKITFAGDKWTVRDDGKVVQAGTHKVDSTKTPGQVDAYVTEGEDKGSTMLGIYELKGDTMKVCFDPKGKMRPTSFTAKAGQMSATIQREKK
jgi:uncharacterized protein (TIGR03067 family)